jgi:hypothetical protein
MATTKTVVQPESVNDSAPRDLAALRAQKKQIEEQIKAAKAAEPQRDRLSAEIARQTEHPNASLPYCMRGMLTRRVAAGQDRAEATTAILAICRDLLDAVDVNGNSNGATAD